MEQTTFKTKDLGEAAILFCYQVELLTVTSANGKCYFHFYPFDQAQQLINQYWQHQLSIDAQDFFHALNRMKQIVIERKKA